MTTNMNLLKFDKNVYLSNGKITYATRSIIEKIADEASQHTIKNIFFISVGGSISIMWPIQTILNQLTSLPIFVEQAAEIVLTGHKQLTKDSLVIMASKSGDTPETVEAAKWCHKQGIAIVSLIGVPDSPLEKYSRWVIPNEAKNGIEYKYMQLYMFVLKLLANRGEFNDYTQFADQLRYLPENLLNAKIKFEPLAKQIAEKTYQEPYMLWIGGSEMWGEVYLFTMCVLEEMQWIKTKSVTSSEFFHGTLELVEEDTCVFLIKGEGKCRAIDDRVEHFIKQHSKKVFIIDPLEYALKNIDDKFRWILAPTICSTLIVDRLAFHYEACTHHDLDMRRYYRVTQY